VQPALYLIAACSLFLILVLLRLRRSTRRKAHTPYARRPVLLSRGELAFYRVLQAALPRAVTVCFKVRLADLVAVQETDWEKFGRPINGRHIDFVLLDEETRILLAVELDDRTHEWRRERDPLVDAVLEAAGVPFLRATAASRYDVAVLRRLLKQRLRHRG
jgi:hypothetical protein